MRTRTLPISPFRNVFSRNSLVAQLLGLGPFTAVAQVQFLLWELRSCKPWGMAKNKQKNWAIQVMQMWLDLFSSLILSFQFIISLL